MTLGWHCPTLMMYGCDGLAPWLRGRAERVSALVVDGAVADAPVTALVREQLARTGHAVATVELTGSGELPEVTALARRLSGTRLVVAVGGGSLLDQAKLAVLLNAAPATRARLTAPQRSGLVLLPTVPVSARAALVAVPTTLGTGSESSSVACLTMSGAKRLVMGASLTPDVAVIDPLATSTLPPELVAEGVLEVVFRLAGLYAGDHTDAPTEDALARALALRAVELGWELRAARAAGDGAGHARLRAETAKVSGLSHAGWVVLGRPPYASKGWYLANELSSVLGVRKMTAVAALLPPLWRAVTDGDTRLGSARRLAGLWQALRTNGPRELSADPATGVAQLADAWEVDRRLTADDAQLKAVSARALRAWGAGLPMLDGLTSTDITDLLRRATRNGTS
ncbi:daptide-type RiPP biosynthesis dehydogenase [Streptomyces sp. NPDC029674]|uniref:daptide-type RiPP biosynthesis dehydogenase n=1 Tax=Streptomyces sp. NPDC029674 TaxID=3365297 RepID=UPI00385159B9